MLDHVIFKGSHTQHGFKNVTVTQTSEKVWFGSMAL